MTLQTQTTATPVLSPAELRKQQALERAARRRQNSDPKPPKPKAPAPPKPEILTDAEGSDTIWGAIFGTLVGLCLVGAGLAIGFGVTGLGGETQSYWYLSRAAGFVAYLLLWGSVVWGLLLSSRIAQGALRAPALLDAHQFLSNVGLGFAFFHGLILMGDRYLSFPLQAVLVPFQSTYEPLLVAAGQIGLWLSVLLIASFYVRRFIGQKAWRAIHMSSFVAFLLALLHGVLVGSESGQLWAQLMYLFSGGSVMFLVLYRILSMRGRTEGRLAPERSRAASA